MPKTRHIIAAILLAACAATAQAEDKVAVGIGGSASDAPLFIGKDMGLFAKEGLNVDLVFLDSGAKVIPPLGTGQLDAGSGAISVGFYNAIARGVHFRIVSDRGHTDSESLYQTVFVRKDLIDSGAFKTLADLKGRSVGFAAPGVTALSLLNETAKAGGFAFGDVKQVFMSFPQQAAAMENKALDASFMVEPQQTQLEKAGIGVRFMNTNDIYPHQQITTLFYSDNFAEARKDIAERFTRAWIESVRVYVTALQKGRLRGPRSDEIVPVIARELSMKPDIIRDMYAAAVDPDGTLNLDSMQKDLSFFQAQGWVPASVTLPPIVDTSFIQHAVAKLGPYKPAMTQ